MLPIPIKPIWQPIVVWQAVLSIIDFFMIAVGKDRATYGGWRMPEKRMFFIALIGCWAGLA